MHYGRSRSPVRRSYIGPYNSYSSDLSSYSSRNPSIQRVINSDFSVLERSRSPVRDFSVGRLSGIRPLSCLNGESSPVLRRRERDFSKIRISATDTSVSYSTDDFSNISPKTRNTYDFSSPITTRYNSYGITGYKKPQRIDYSDYLRPVLQDRPFLKKDFVPRSRAEREKGTMPVVRERKLIKFREITNDILSKVKRKVSWDMPEETDSPSTEERKINCDSSTTREINSRDNSLTRFASRETPTRTPLPSPLSLSPRTSESRRSSGDQILDTVRGKPTVHLKSREYPEVKINTRLPTPPPRKKSIDAAQKIKKTRKPSIETAEERNINYSVVADEIKRNREAAEKIKLFKDELESNQEQQFSKLNQNETESGSSSNQTEISYHVDAETFQNGVKNTISRNYRRRRRDADSVEAEQTRARCRSRIRSRIEDTKCSNLRTPPKSGHAETSNESLHPISRMHRKSVKYKVDCLAPRFSSKASQDCPSVPENVESTSKIDNDEEHNISNEVLKSSLESTSIVKSVEDKSSISKVSDKMVLEPVESKSGIKLESNKSSKHSEQKGNNSSEIEKSQFMNKETKMTVACDLPVKKNQSSTSSATEVSLKEKKIKEKKEKKADKFSKIADSQDDSNTSAFNSTTFKEGKTQKIDFSNKLNDNLKTEKRKKIKDSFSKQAVVDQPVQKESEEVIVVKLPQPKRCTEWKATGLLTETIPTEQNIVVSVVKKASTVEAVCITEKTSDSNNRSILSQLNIPEKHTLPCTTKAELNKEVPEATKNKYLRTRSSSALCETADVNVTHTIVLKPKPQGKATVDHVLTAEAQKSNDFRLKAIPDVIQSTIHDDTKNSTVENVSDVLKSNLTEETKASENKLKFGNPLILPSIKESTPKDVNLKNKKVSEDAKDKYSEITAFGNDLPDVTKNGKTSTSKKVEPHITQEKLTVNNSSKGKASDSVTKLNTGFKIDPKILQDESSKENSLRDNKNTCTDALKNAENKLSQVTECHNESEPDILLNQTKLNEESPKSNKIVNNVPKAFDSKLNTKGSISTTMQENKKKPSVLDAAAVKIDSKPNGETSKKADSSLHKERVNFKPDRQQNERFDAQKEACDVHDRKKLNAVSSADGKKVVISEGTPNLLKTEASESKTLMKKDYATAKGKRNAETLATTESKSEIKDILRYDAVVSPSSNSISSTTKTKDHKNKDRLKEVKLGPNSEGIGTPEIREEKQLSKLSVETVGNKKAVLQKGSDAVVINTPSTGNDSKILNLAQKTQNSLEYLKKTENVKESPLDTLSNGSSLQENVSGITRPKLNKQKWKGTVEDETKSSKNILDSPKPLSKDLVSDENKTEKVQKKKEEILFTAKCDAIPQRSSIKNQDFNKNASKPSVKLVNAKTNDVVKDEFKGASSLPEKTETKVAALNKRDDRLQLNISDVKITNADKHENSKLEKKSIDTRNNESEKIIDFDVKILKLAKSEKIPYDEENKMSSVSNELAKKRNFIAKPKVTEKTNKNGQTIEISTLTEQISVNNHAEVKSLTVNDSSKRQTSTAKLEITEKANKVSKTSEITALAKEIPISNHAELESSTVNNASEKQSSAAKPEITGKTNMNSEKSGIPSPVKQVSENKHAELKSCIVNDAAEKQSLATKPEITEKSNKNTEALEISALAKQIPLTNHSKLKSSTVNDASEKQNFTAKPEITGKINKNAETSELSTSAKQVSVSKHAELKSSAVGDASATKPELTGKINKKAETSEITAFAKQIQVNNQAEIKSSISVEQSCTANPEIIGKTNKNIDTSDVSALAKQTPITKHAELKSSIVSDVSEKQSFASKSEITGKLIKKVETAEISSLAKQIPVNNYAEVKFSTVNDAMKVENATSLSDSHESTENSLPKTTSSNFENTDAPAVRLKEEVLKNSKPLTDRNAVGLSHEANSSPSKPSLQDATETSNVKCIKTDPVPKSPAISSVAPPPPKLIGLQIRNPQSIPETISESSSEESSESEDSDSSEFEGSDSSTEGNQPARRAPTAFRVGRFASSDATERRNVRDHVGFVSSDIIKRSTHDRTRDVMPFREYNINDFTFLKVLGKGSFGKVLLATLKNTHLYFAVKALKKDVLLEDDDVESASIEKKILVLGTKHPYMCKLYCSFQSESYLFFVMEYLNGGDLMFHITAGRFELGRTVFYAAEIVSALKFLHKRGIIYRDIKLDNVMLDRDGHIRLVDFGMCHCYIYKEECLPCNFCGTPMYIAPEILNGEVYNQAVDWWSFGVLLYEMLNGRSPFCGTDDDELFWSICNEEPAYPRYLTKESVDILKLFLTKKPQDRLGSLTCPAGEIEHQAFFSSIDWKKIERKEVKPPVKPKIKNAYDCRNFDRSFTQMDTALTPVSPATLSKIDQKEFTGFTYTNPNITGN